MKNKSLPDRDQALEMVLRMEAPFQTVAWIMLETGMKFADVQVMRVRDVQFERGLLVCGRREHELSTGLMEALDDYIRRILRPAFEQWKRGSGHPGFTSIKLFPAWILDGYEQVPVNVSLPLNEYVAAMQVAADAAGFQGMVHSNTLRLVVAREWLRQGMSVTDLHQRLDHSDVMTTILLAQTLQYGELTFAAAA